MQQATQAPQNAKKHHTSTIRNKQYKHTKYTIQQGITYKQKEYIRYKNTSSGIIEGIKVVEYSRKGVKQRYEPINAL
jgi:hypothetical protein